MNIDSFRKLACLALLPMVAGCASVPSILEEPGDSRFGEANRQTMMAQVIDPDPVYDEPMTGSGEQTQKAVERYRTDAVKQPDGIRTTDAGSASGPQ
ncbi:hypothetical protein [Sphingopyxis flava]|uniref:Beta-barrel assembly machine subunit BamF n=1 Tax=Sphingopyxis flava TaxID=1507287 RepID=A0A1T5EW23_9SPHN|nr:hypothetical protein [Sphingopyxis flava]SKB88019.1 hypothetical protein SAMN06295937_102540 [Sphingopyxis flava]